MEFSEMSHITQKVDAIHNGRVKKEDGVTSYYREDESLLCKRFDKDGNEINEKVVDFYENGSIKESSFDNKNGELLETVIWDSIDEASDYYLRDIEKSTVHFGWYNYL